MSKKKKKNTNYKTNKQPATQLNPKQVNPLTLVLIAAVLIVAIVGTVFIVKDYNNNTSNVAPTVPADVNPAGNDTEDIAKYLNEKYGVEFVHEFTSAGASVFSAEGLPGLVQVFRREVVQSFDANLDHLFTDVYADNGYMIINMQKAVDYYKEFISVDFGNCKYMTYIDIIANPSSVTKSTPYTQYLKAIENLSIPELIILTDKTLSEEERATLKNELTEMGTPIAIRVFTMDSKMQAQCNPGDIMQVGSTHKDVQYYEILNADHILED